MGVTASQTVTVIVPALDYVSQLMEEGIISQRHRVDRKYFLGDLLVPPKLNFCECSFVPQVELKQNNEKSKFALVKDIPRKLFLCLEEVREPSAKLHLRSAIAAHFIRTCRG